MNTLEPNNPEIPAMAKTPGSELEGIRRLVDAAFEDMDVSDVQFAVPPDEAVPVDTEGQVVDSAQHQRIKEAEQAVLDAWETMPDPDPAQFRDLLPG
jgi:hypothetical protein